MALVTQQRRQEKFRSRKALVEQEPGAINGEKHQQTSHPYVKVSFTYEKGYVATLIEQH